MFNKVFNYIKNFDEVISKIDDEDTVSSIKWALSTSVLLRITDGHIPILTGDVCEGTKAAFCYPEDWDDDGNNFDTLHVVYVSISDNGEYYEPNTKKLRKWFERDMGKITTSLIKTMEKYMADRNTEFSGAKWKIICDYASVKLVKDDDGEPNSFEIRVHHNALKSDKDCVGE